MRDAMLFAPLGKRLKAVREASRRARQHEKQNRAHERQFDLSTEHLEADVAGQPAKPEATKRRNAGKNDDQKDECN